MNLFITLTRRSKGAVIRLALKPGLLTRKTRVLVMRCRTAYLRKP